jgi:hypothetical protein
MTFSDYKDLSRVIQAFHRILKSDWRIPSLQDRVSVKLEYFQQFFSFLVISGYPGEWRFSLRGDRAKSVPSPTSDSVFMQTVHVET